MSVQKTIWERTRSLLVLYVYENPEKFQQFRSALDVELNESAVTRLKVIVLNKNPKENVVKHSLFSYMSEKDINFFTNRIKKKKGDVAECAEVVLGDSFDLFLCFGDPGKKVVKWLNKMKVSQKVSINSESYPFFNLNLQSTVSSLDNSVKFVSGMLNKIN